MIVVREATEDLYAGIEYEVGSDEARELTEWIGARRALRDEAGISIKPISGRGHAPHLRVRVRLRAQELAAAR